MSIKPIDLQSNISQMSEVGKSEQVKTGAIAEQQHLLDKESNEKSKLVNTRLDETKKGEKTAIRDEYDKKKKKREAVKKKAEESNNEKEQRKFLNDEKMGRIIDVLK